MARPSLTMTQPTLGFGAVRPRARSPSAIASPIQSSSVIHPEALFQLLILALAFGEGLVLPLLVDLLLRLDLGVAPVRGPILDVDHLLAGHDVGLPVEV